MLFLLWISFQTMMMEPVKLEDLGTFQSLYLQLYKFDDQYLALVNNEPRLTLFDGAGTIHATYAKKGHGAEDLHHPQFLGASANRLYILSNARRLLVFDKKLKLLESKESGLPPTMSQGLLFGNYLRDDQFLLYAFQHNKHLLHQVQLNRSFLLKKSYYAREMDLQTKGTYQWLHRNRHFVADMISKHSDSYMVQVRQAIRSQKSKEHPILLELIAPIDDFPTRDVREPVILSEMVTTDQGYIVELAVLMPQAKGGSFDLNSLDFYWDFFNARGINLKRENAGEKRLKPVRNSTEIFIVESGEGDVDFIQPYKK